MEQLDEREVNGQKWHVLPVPTEMISDVILGARASEDLADRIRRVLEILGAKTRLRRAYMHPRK